MRAEWTGALIGRMHNADVTMQDMADEIGCSKPYISMILNGVRNPSDARQRLELAFEKIIARKTSYKTD